MTRKKVLNVILSVLLIVSSITMATSASNAQATSKKASFITNKKFVGTYGYKGKKGSYKKGWYELTINKITSAGKVRFQIGAGGPNGSRLRETDVLTAKIIGNKATFKYKDDGWGNKGKGTILFQKNGSIFLTVKDIYNAGYGASLEIPKTIFKKTSKKH